MLRVSAPDQRVRVSVPGPDVEGDVSAADVERYLEARGWRRVTTGAKWSGWSRETQGLDVPRLQDRDTAAALRRVIVELARDEGRAASAVLRDVEVLAREPHPELGAPPDPADADEPSAGDLAEAVALAGGAR